MYNYYYYQQGRNLRFLFLRSGLACGQKNMENVVDFSLFILHS